MRKAEKQKIREFAEKSFRTAAYWAKKSGLTLIRRSPSHYQISSPDGWMVNLYPTTGRIWEDRGRLIPGPPLDLPCGWTLMDAVRVAAERVGKSVPGGTEVVEEIPSPSRPPAVLARKPTPVQARLHAIAAEAIRRRGLSRAERAECQHLAACAVPRTV